MNRFADLTDGLRRRRAGEKIMKTLEQLEELEILRDLPEGSGKTRQVRLPYSSDPRSFEEPWK
jgi:hypothetical protein